MADWLHDREATEYEHDPYRLKHQPAGTAKCERCQAWFHEGRWSWADPGAVYGPAVVCPACRRIADAYPAAVLELGGAYLAAHKDEVLNLIENAAALEGKEHPLERIMAIETSEQGLRVTTTGLHLARRLGNAIHRACRGELHLRYLDGEDQLRVTWRRDA